MRKIICATAAIIGVLSGSVQADNAVKTQKRGLQTCVYSNGTPNHSIGRFPTKGNPNSFQAQKVEFCFPSDPVYTGKADSRASTIGVTLTGIPIRPGTADWYDASSRRGHSRDRSSGWNLEALTPIGKVFGLDQNNAHVDNQGLYHYHGMPSALVDLDDKSLVGYAADGHEIHYVGSDAKSSWVLKSGVRPTAPGGKYDGTYLQDWVFQSGAGNLDECNGINVDGRYIYFATDSFPYFGRCHMGTPSKDFISRRPR
jgi:hypothetical protein